MASFRIVGAVTGDGECTLSSLSSVFDGIFKYWYSSANERLPVVSWARFQRFRRRLIACTCRLSVLGILLLVRDGKGEPLGVAVGETVGEGLGICGPGSSAIHCATPP